MDYNYNEILAALRKKKKVSLFILLNHKTLPTLRFTFDKELAIKQQQSVRAMEKNKE